MRIKFMRIFPEIWASTECPFFSSTRNMAFGSVSVTVPSTSIACSFCIRFRLLPVNSPDAFGRGGKHFRLAITNDDAVFEVGAGPAIGGDGGPAVLEHAH